MNVVFPKLKSFADPESFTALQTWIYQMRDLMRNGISYAENMNSQFLSVEFVGGTAPAIAYVSQAKPRAVFRCDLESLSPASNTPPVVADQWSWTWQNGQLTFPSLASLSGRFRLTVLVVRG